MEQNRCQRNESFNEQKNIASQWPKKCLIHQTRNISSHWLNQEATKKSLFHIPLNIQSRFPLPLFQIKKKKKKKKRKEVTKNTY